MKKRLWLFPLAHWRWGGGVMGLENSSVIFREARNSKRVSNMLSKDRINYALARLGT